MSEDGLTIAHKVMILGLAMVLIIMVGVTVRKLNQSAPYRDALTESMYAILVREGNIDTDKVTGYKFKTEVVNESVKKNDVITSPEELEILADKVLLKLSEVGGIAEPISKDRFMNLLKIEYSVMNRNTKVGKKYNENM